MCTQLVPFLSSLNCPIQKHLYTIHKNDRKIIIVKFFVKVIVIARNRYCRTTFSVIYLSLKFIDLLCVFSSSRLTFAPCLSNCYEPNSILFCPVRPVSTLDDGNSFRVFARPSNINNIYIVPESIRFFLWLLQLQWWWPQPFFYCISSETQKWTQKEKKHSEYPQNNQHWWSSNWEINNNWTFYFITM